jgi:hypothetical protein
LDRGKGEKLEDNEKDEGGEKEERPIGEELKGSPLIF